VSWREQTGTTPARWLRDARVRRAQHLLETTTLDMESVATAVGLGSANSLRDMFRQLVMTSPRDYRRAFSPRAQLSEVAPG
jgi:transcriptional regulator GlxA family with amidase domain